MNRFLKSVLKTAVFVVDQYYDQAYRASNRVSDLVDRGKKMIVPPEDRMWRNALSFAAGVGIGVGAGMLLAPASGQEIRNSITDKVRNIRGQAG